MSFENSAGALAITSDNLPLMPSIPVETPFFRASPIAAAWSAERFKSLLRLPLASNKSDIAMPDASDIV